LPFGLFFEYNFFQMGNTFLALLKTLALLPVFLLFTFLIFYLPGRFLISFSKKKFREDEDVLLSFALGVILFFLINLIFALIGLRFLSPLVFLPLIFLTLKRFKLKVLSSFLALLKQKFLLVSLLFGTLVEGMINFPSSLPFSQGHLYWSAQGHDGLWHVAVIETIKKYFPIPNPLYAGESLYNYHYFVDFIMAEFGRFFPIFSTLDLYYRFFPFLIAFLIGLAAYSFLTTWQKNKKIGLLGIFFTYFVGSLGYLVLLIQRRGFFGGETIFWAAQGNTIIGNPPHAFCYFLVPCFLLSLYYFFKEKNKFFFLFCLLLGGFLAGFKISAGFVLVIGLAAASFFSLILKKNREVVGLTALVGLTNLAVFKSITRGGASFLMFQPWWFIRTMVVAHDRVNWINLEHRRQFYLARGGIQGLLRVIQLEATAFLMFLVGNLGTRVIGFLAIFKGLFHRTIFTDPLESTIFFALLTSFLVPLLFIQKGVVYNLIQFMQYFLLLFGFYGAIALYGVLKGFKNKTWKYIFLAIFVFLSIPTVIGNLVEFYGKNALAIVTYEEIEALDFLKTNVGEKEIILTKPHNVYAKGLYESQPWPIYAWESTAYVSAYTGKQTFYTDEGQMRILGLETEERLEKMNDFFNPGLSLEDKENFLKSEEIKFIYLRTEEVEDQREIFSELGLEKIFENGEVAIYLVN
jgi:hypothetical protein